LDLAVLRERITEITGRGCHLSVQTMTALLPEASGKFRLSNPAA